MVIQQTDIEKVEMKALQLHEINPYTLVISSLIS